MSDTMTGPALTTTGTAEEGGDLSNMILETDDKTWAKLRQILKVNTREEAAELVSTSKEAAQAAENILMSGNTLLTEQEDSTMLGEAGTEPDRQASGGRPNPADVLYGGKSKSRGRKSKLEF